MLETLKPVLKDKFQVDTIGIFGSYSQGQQKQTSDVDLLLPFIEPNEIDLLDFIALKQFLRRKLRVKGDLVEKKALKMESWKRSSMYGKIITRHVSYRLSWSLPSLSKSLKTWRTVSYLNPYPSATSLGYTCFSFLKCSFK
jgi:uncharacterized protein